MTTPLPGGSDGLFGAGEVAAAELPVTGLRSRPTARLAAVDAALAGDGYAWLKAMLRPPQPPQCETCRTPMRLPAGAPVLWTCPRCHPAEAA